MLDLLHMLLLLLDLLDEVLVLEGSMVERLDEVLAIDVLERGKLIKFLVLELLELATQTSAEGDQEVTLKRFVH